MLCLENMKLVPINRNEFSLWIQFRSKTYPLISDEYNLKEIENIFESELWHCWFIEREDGIRIVLVKPT